VQHPALRFLVGCGMLRLLQQTSWCVLGKGQTDRAKADLSGFAAIPFAVPASVVNLRRQRAALTTVEN
jgi:hypothetical protein